MEDKLFVFPPPPTADAVEWAGTPIGRSNTITRTKGRTAKYDKTVDRKPGLLEHLLELARAKMERDRSKTFIHDVIIHGIRVRAHTNSRHLYDFWVENWYDPSEWRKITGHEPPEEPKVNVYAFTGVAEAEEAAYYSRAHNIIVFFNTAYYGQLKSWVLGAVGRVLAEEHGIHSIHGACVARDGKGILYIAPTGTGKSTASYGLMAWEKSRFHSDDWVYVRYAYHTRDGRLVSPLVIRSSDGRRAQGFQVYRWIEDNRHDKEAELHCWMLDNREVNLKLKDLDLSVPLEAYAYTSEKIFYLRSNLVEGFPESAYQMVRSDFENCPDVTPAFMEKQRAVIETAVEVLCNSSHPKIAAYFKSMPRKELEVIVGRMIAFDNARNMLDITKVFPPERVFFNPMEPVRLVCVMLLKRDFSDCTILESLDIDKFMMRLMIGETPEKKREIAYNAYRAVDDDAEKAFVQALERKYHEANARGDTRSFYQLYLAEREIPDTLWEEFELFRAMFQAAACYDMNTVLQKDPEIKSKRDAILLTMHLIAKVLEEQPRGIRLTIDNYRQFVAADDGVHRS